MQEKLTIARPYALAAFDYATESGAVAAWSAMLEELAIVVGHDEFNALIGHPRISGEDLQQMLDSLLSAHLDDKRRNFVRALIDAERLEVAPEVAELFERHRSAAEGVVEVTVESAYEVSDSEKARIASAVSARIGKSCDVNVVLDPDLVGGAVIKVGDSVIDISLRGRLRALEQRLL